MGDFVPAAVFVYSADSASLQEKITQFAPDVKIQAISAEQLLADPDAIDSTIEHLVISAPLGLLKSIVEVAVTRGLSIGILPLPEQKHLIKYFRLPDIIGKQIALAFQPNTQARDLITCNGNIVFFKATIGRLPVIDGSGTLSRWGTVKRVFRRLRGIRLLTFKFTVGDKQQIKTAACGAMLLQHHHGTLASKLISYDSSARDGMISMIIAAPLSKMEYLTFLYQVLTLKKHHLRIPKTIGYIKTSQLTVETETPLKVDIDGVLVINTPVECRVQPGALKINTGPAPAGSVPTTTNQSERIDIGNLPMGSELDRAKKKVIPFFPYASEERFKDLFSALRQDARTTTAYVVLMVLSTVLATIGLYLNSTSVVIGAMLLAPLMSPIVSVSMGMLRSNAPLFRQSIITVATGVGIALFSAALITFLFPYKPVTNEMLGRLSPSLLDLGVAIFAGIAGAYTKAYKEIMQSLAGVAIAVALVPPLAVAGIGLGRADPYFFMQAFLLFSTNLIGIIFAASLTFRILGYSAAIKSKKSFAYVAIIMALITVPLYLTYDEIVEDLRFQKAWQQERFLVNGKYIIVVKAERHEHHARDIITMKIRARDTLTRKDMDDFKNKVQANFSRKFVIHASIVYIF